MDLKAGMMDEANCKTIPEANPLEHARDLNQEQKFTFWPDNNHEHITRAALECFDPVKVHTQI